MAAMINSTCKIIAVLKMETQKTQSYLCYNENLELGKEVKIIKIINNKAQIRTNY
jgi:uncharacterized beta-barrel protein YwiB (DUF1934 family)